MTMPNTFLLADMRRRSPRSFGILSEIFFGFIRNTKMKIHCFLQPNGGFRM